MPSPPNLTNALRAVMQSSLPDHYRLVLVSLLRHQARQKGEHWGLAWPSVDTIAGDTHSVTPEQVASALQHMAHARILRSHGTTSGGHVFWEIRIEQLALTDPLLQTMLSTRLRAVEGLGATARHVLHELSMVGDTNLRVSASYRDIRRSLPWLTAGAWRWSIRRLAAAGVLREIRRGNRFHGTTWEIRIPQPDTQLHPSSDEPDTQLHPSSDEPDTQLHPSSDELNTQLPPSSDELNTQLPPAHPYMNKPSMNRPISEPAYLTASPTSGMPNTQLPPQASAGQVSQEARFIHSIEKRVDKVSMPDLDTLRGLAAAWEERTGRTINPEWADALWEAATRPDIKAPVGFITHRFRRLVSQGLNLSESPMPADRPAERRRDRYASGHEELDERPSRDEELQERSPPVEIDPAAHRIWSAALGDLAMQVTRPSYDTWLKSTHGVAVEGSGLVVGAPNTFMAEMLERRMHRVIVEAVDRVTKGEVTEVRFMVVSGYAARSVP